jgi:hypothetical protein
VVRDAQANDLWSNAAEIARLADAARSGKAVRAELTGSTITITSLGKLGGIVTTPVINHPEVAIVGVNKIAARPVIRDGAVVARQLMNLSSSFDHRVVDGADAAAFIQSVRATSSNRRCSSSSSKEKRVRSGADACGASANVLRCLRRKLSSHGNRPGGRPSRASFCSSWRLSDSLLARLPLSTSMLYLAVGVAVSHSGSTGCRSRRRRTARALERIAEVVLLLSLFGSGLKMSLGLSDGRWLLPLRLAVVSMLVTVALIAGAGVAWLGLPLGAAILLGGILAPTDPVLASDVQVAEPTDRDRLRFALTGEAGLNDGTAFPFVLLGLGLLGLHDLGNSLWRWLAIDVLWGVASASASARGSARSSAASSSTCGERTRKRSASTTSSPSA